jgi:hypothetical protein
MANAGLDSFGPTQTSGRRPRFSGCIMGSALALFSGHISERGGRWVGPRQEFIETSVRMAVDDLRDGRSEIRIGIDSVELAGLDQRSNYCPMLGTAIGARKQRVLAIECDGTDRSLDNIGVDLDAAVVDKAGEPSPA